MKILFYIIFYIDIKVHNMQDTTIIDKEYTFDEVKMHNKETDCWIVINNLVYDVTKFLNEHPGGLVILHHAGKDCTDAFNDIDHSVSTKELLNKYLIGKIKK